MTNWLGIWLKFDPKNGPVGIWTPKNSGTTGAFDLRFSAVIDLDKINTKLQVDDVTDWVIT